MVLQGSFTFYSPTIVTGLGYKVRAKAVCIGTARRQSCLCLLCAVHSSPAHDSPPLVHRLLRRHHPLLFSRPLRRPRLAHRGSISCGRSRLAHRRPSAPRRLHPAIRLPLPGCSWRIPLRSRDDKLGYVQHTQSADVSPQPTL